MTPTEVLQEKIDALKRQVTDSQLFINDRKNMGYSYFKDALEAERKVDKLQSEIKQHTIAILNLENGPKPFGPVEFNKEGTVIRPDRSATINIPTTGPTITSQPNQQY